MGVIPLLPRLQNYKAFFPILLGEDMRAWPGKGSHLEQEEDAWKQSWSAHIRPFLRSQNQIDKNKKKLLFSFKLMGKTAAQKRPFSACPSRSRRLAQLLLGGAS